MPMKPRPRVAVEALGLILSAAWAVILLAHALGGAKRALLLDDGDTVLLPMIKQSFERGQPIEWGMSPVLFVFPELPLYLAAAAVTSTVAAALLVSGVVNVVILYGLLRAVTGRVAPGRAGVGVAAALSATALFSVLSLLETRPGGNSGEIASLYLTTTYYSGTVMALVAAIGLTLHLAGVPGGRITTRRRMRVAPIALALLSALATLSNPLFVLWATAPLVVALGALALLTRFTPARTRSGPRRPVTAAAALLVGAGVGYLGREPLQRFIIADKTEYLRFGGGAASLRFFGDSAAVLVQTPGGVVEAAVGILLTVAVVVLTIGRLTRGRRDPATVAGLVVVATVVVVPVGLLVTGSLSTRYAMPLMFTPIVALAALVADALVHRRPRAWRERVQGREQEQGRKGQQGRGRRVPAVVAGVAVVLLLTVVLVVPGAGRVVAAGRSLGDPAAGCLTNWARGKDVAGVAQFWTGRPLEAYGGADVDVLQVNSDFTVYPWLVNLAAYRDARVGYVIVATGPTPGDHLEGWGDSVTDLGTPRAVVRCDGYDIDDFRGTPGETALTQRVEGSARVLAALRGLGW
ncbi:hypothetical protein [Frondihabitans sp. PAMC 28766]|uniref:hypothetical protein n=1 Tax=Frondihabitans sp. PAMC 28766 TaxID=1795630 RepID=UPI0012FFAD7E|nr:hypothetical protein [Frondihabitans sp. PAMC 28766]